MFGLGLALAKALNLKRKCNPEIGSALEARSDACGAPGGDIGVVQEVIDLEITAESRRYLPACEHVPDEVRVDGLAGDKVALASD